MERIYKEGRAKAIGVSNFHPESALSRRLGESEEGPGPCCLRLQRVERRPCAPLCACAALATELSWVRQPRSVMDAVLAGRGAGG